MGLEWSEWRRLGAECGEDRPGLYRIGADGFDHLLYVGETRNVRDRVQSHARLGWGVNSPGISFALLPDDTPKYAMRELENDLIAAHFGQLGFPPLAQFNDGPGPS